MDENEEATPTPRYRKGTNAQRRRTRRLVNRPSKARAKFEATIARARVNEKLAERLTRKVPWKNPAAQGKPRYPGQNRARAQRRAYRGGLQAMGARS